MNTTHSKGENLRCGHCRFLHLLRGSANPSTESTRKDSSYEMKTVGARNSTKRYEGWAKAPVTSDEPLEGMPLNPTENFSEKRESSQPPE
jgi:hypothetical protein